MPAGTAVLRPPYGTVHGWIFLWYFGIMRHDETSRTKHLRPSQRCVMQHPRLQARRAYPPESRDEFSKVNVTYHMLS
jgi:hypothetical protein